LGCARCAADPGSPAVVGTPDPISGKCGLPGRPMRRCVGRISVLSGLVTSPCARRSRGPRQQRLRRDFTSGLAVGTALAGGPRTGPYVQHDRVRLLLRVFGEKTLVGVRVQEWVKPRKSKDSGLP
jgi:hypothetical protein